MSKQSPTRRDFLKTSSVAAVAGASVPYWLTASRAQAQAKNDRLTTAAIGTGGRGSGIGNQLRGRSDMVAVCDVDKGHAERFKRGDGKITVYEDFRKLLERKDIDAVTIGTPDHWHTRIVLTALRSGKDVYCEKPLTLTIDEGKMLVKTVKETGQILQVGTQQRTEFGRNFLRAVVMAQSGRLGKIKKVTAAIGRAPKQGPFKKTDPPAGLNWDFWLGQSPKVDYISQRCHGNFRWWYEYSGGKMTDWGAHHVDIAQWAIGMQNTGPKTVEGLSATHPVPFKDGYPTKDEERTIVDRMAVTHTDTRVEPVISPEDIVRVRSTVDEIYVDDKIRDYIIELVFTTRDPKGHGLDELANLIDCGASPRASIALTLAAKAHAFLQGRGYVTPQDVKSVGMDVLRHRIILSYEAEAEERGTEDILQTVFDATKVP
ncbi:MAG: Gfo/Idh/MocA family oxidoreductase [Planctomycetes bacterium]|nr:Gfo/Idh/MocA family oxidoreductase [Planctomycetota bacterium]